MFSVLIFCVIVLVIGALAAYVVNHAPFLDGGLKSIAVWGIVAVTVLVVIAKLLTLI
jgi:hypothetical protein